MSTDHQNRLIATHKWLSLYCGFRDEPFIQCSDGVMIVPITTEGDILFISEPAIYDHLPKLILPSGAVDEGETPALAANREMQEEIGYRAERIELLHAFRPLARHGNTSLHAFLARDLTPSRLQGDEPYELPITRVPLNSFEPLLSTGALVDSTVIAALYMAREHIRRHP